MLEMIEVFIMCVILILIAVSSIMVILMPIFVYQIRNTLKRMEAILNIFTKIHLLDKEIESIDIKKE